MALPAGTTLLLLAAWEGLAAVGTLPDEVPSTAAVVYWLLDQFGGSEFWLTVGDTLWHWSAGLVLGGLAGVVVGAIAGSLPIVEKLLNWPLEFLRPIPAIVYLPLMILVMGSRAQTAILMGAVGALWPMLFQAIYAVRAIDPVAVETSRVFGLTRRQRVTRVIVPSILPHLATGLRISSSLALVVVISAELIGGVPGIGAALSTASINGRYAATYGLLVFSGLLGLTLNLILESSERRLLGWHVSHRDVPR
jgi:ABC-type nitrate/sulfonate/bicarbonate transport system permease component